MNKNKNFILIVDDDKAVADSHANILESLGYQTLVECDSRRVESVVENHPAIQMVLLDIRMPHLNGIELLKRIKAQKPQVGIIMVTVLNDIELAVDAIKSGAYNYLLKPINPIKLNEVLESYINLHSKNVSIDPEFNQFITQSAQFSEIFRRIKSFSSARVPVLIEGETGTGKELIAQLLHSHGPNASDPFIAINTAALSSELFESQLFGHAKGSFTGAHQDKDGYFDVCRSGTLFLDEIGDVDLDQQKKLLRVLQEGKYCRLGETKSRTLKARMVFATNRPLKSMSEEGQFRDDLYYRIASHIIELPPLRERVGDIKLLSEYFLTKYCTQYGRMISGLSDEALEALDVYNFPGNVRELEGLISGAVLIEMLPILQLDSFPDHIHCDLNDQSLESKKYIEAMATLARCNGNQTLASKKLGIARQTLNRWLKEYKAKSKFL